MTERAVDELLSGLILGRSSSSFLVSLFSLFACRGDLDVPLSSLPIPGQGAPRYKCPDMGVPWSEICRRHGPTGHGPSRVAHERGGYFPVRKGADRNVTSGRRRTNMWEWWRGGRCDGREAWKQARHVVWHLAGHPNLRPWATGTAVDKSFSVLPRPRKHQGPDGHGIWGEDSGTTDLQVQCLAQWLVRGSRRVAARRRQSMGPPADGRFNLKHGFSRLLHHANNMWRRAWHSKLGSSQHPMMDMMICWRCGFARQSFFGLSDLRLSLSLSSWTSHLGDEYFKTRDVMAEVDDCGGKVVGGNQWLKGSSRTDDVKIKLSSKPLFDGCCTGIPSPEAGAAMQPSALKPQNKTLDGV